MVPVSEIEKEDFNLNIRRYVDNSPAAEAQDVQAHIAGGIPMQEVNNLQEQFDLYSGLKDLLFSKRDENYFDFTQGIKKKEDIKEFVENADGVRQTQQRFRDQVQLWWQENVSALENLPTSQEVYTLRRDFLNSIVCALEPLNHLDKFKIRGAFASYFQELEADFRSVAASGWNANLIPDEDILSSQFPEVLEQLEKDQARISELEGIFAEAEARGEDDEIEDLENSVLNKADIKQLKADKKELSAELRLHKKELKNLTTDAKTRAKIAGTKFQADEDLLLRSPQLENEIDGRENLISVIDKKLAYTDGLAKELKELKANIKAVEKQKDELVEAARKKISAVEAKELILQRFEERLHKQFNGYTRARLQSCIASLENLFDKYSLTLRTILKERDAASAKLDDFLQELYGLNVGV